jgi:MoaA/NifB/PqqE/SkfB family radical SAM enzyme
VAHCRALTGSAIISLPGDHLLSASVIAVNDETLSRAPLRRLPLATLYLTERCNSRCVTCDYWRHGRADMNFAAVRTLLPALQQLQTEVVLLSGGEPLMNPDWPAIAELLGAADIKVWLLTSGLSLAKHARRASDLLDAITVSLDGTDPSTYQAIRGLDAFDNVCNGIKAIAALGLAPSIRVTVQRANYRQLPDFVALARQIGARQVSFLAVDVANPHAFGRTESFGSDLTLGADDLSEFDRVLTQMERSCSAEFDSGFIAENPAKLRRIYQYFAAIQGRGAYPQVRCNAPEFSAVLGATGKVQPCFFISGPTPRAAAPGALDLHKELNSDAMLDLRAAIRGGARAECKTCVCSMWRDTTQLAGAIL